MINVVSSFQISILILITFSFPRYFDISQQRHMMGVWGSILDKVMQLKDTNLYNK